MRYRIRKRHSKIIKLLLIIFAVWLIGAPGYFGYALWNDADFLAPLPQLENPDIDFFAVVVKNYHWETISAVQDFGYQRPDGFSIYSFLEKCSTHNATPVLRC